MRTDFLSNIRLRKEVQLGLLCLFCIAAIVFAEIRRDAVLCSALRVDLGDQKGNYFIDKELVDDLLTKRGKDHVVGGKLFHISLKEMENRVKKDKFVEGVQIHRRLSGDLEIKVSQVQPIARFLSKDSSFYLTDKGEFLPISSRFTSRVVPVWGKGLEGNILLKDSSSVIKTEMLLFFGEIFQDEFFKAQIAGVEINQFGELVLYPQVTKQIIEFGEPVNIEEKLKKLRIFYSKILKSDGWNSYERVNLKFKDQIICS